MWRPRRQELPHVRRLAARPEQRNPDLSGYRHRAVVARGGHRLGSNTTPMSAWLLGGDQSRCGGLAASSLDLVAAHPLAAGRRDGRTRLMHVLEKSDVMSIV